jgi:hypothetical protein
MWDCMDTTTLQQEEKCWNYLKHEGGLPLSMTILSTDGEKIPNRCTTPSILFIVLTIAVLLVPFSLVLVAVVIGAITGFVGMLLAKATGWATASVGEDSDGTVFFICFLIGVSMAIILMGVVLSAVDTVIVSFAEAPAEFEMNHPALYQNMVEKWRVAYPNEF